MKTHQKLYLTLGVAASLCACTQEPPAPPPVKAPVYVGTVERVYPQYKYALIRMSGSAFPAGTVMITQSPDTATEPRVANLIITGERLGRSSIPADIRSGQVESGDLVFLYRNLAQPDTKTPQKTEGKDEPVVDQPKPDIEISPGAKVTTDGLLPLPGQAIPIQKEPKTFPGVSGTAPDAAESEAQRAAEQERIRRDLDKVPARFEDESD